MTARIRGALPRTDYDGLQMIAQKYRTKSKRGERVVLIIEAELDRVVERLHDSDDPVDYWLAVRHVEALTDPAEESFARSILAGRYEARTGKAPLPFGTLMEPSTPDEPPEADT